MIAIIKNVNSNLNKVLDLSKYNRSQKFEIYNFYKTHRNYKIYIDHIGEM